MYKKHSNTFSIVAIYTDCFFLLFLGGKEPLLAAYSSTWKPSSTANGESPLTLKIEKIFWLRP